MGGETTDAARKRDPVHCHKNGPADLLYAGTRFGGLTRVTTAAAIGRKSSKDGGNSWKQLTTGLPQDSNTMVIATGGEGARYVKLDKSEIYLSANCGEEWQQILGDLPNICSLALQ